MNRTRLLRKTCLSLLMTTGFILTPIVWSRSAQAQSVVDVNPGLESENVVPDTAISGLFEGDGQASVDPSSVKIFVNNTDVTGRSTITKTFFSYRPDKPLPTGANQVRVQYKNTSGSSRIATWSFNVQSPQNSLKISSVSHNASSEPLGPGSTFLATINGTPGATGSVLLIEDEKTVRQIPAQEVSSGVYVATLNVASNDQIQEGIAVGRLEGQNKTIYSAAPQAVVFSNSAQSTQIPQQEQTSQGTATAASTTSLQPVFTSHQNGSQISSKGFTLEGTTQPSAKVSVKVTSTVPVLGGIVKVGESTLVEQEITADKNGRFQIQVPAPSVLAAGTQYTVRASASMGEQTSTPTQLNLTQK